MSDKHGYKPLFDSPWEKSLVGGSDDHSALHATRMYTEVPKAADLKTFFSGIELGLSKVHGAASTPITLAHNLYGIAFQFFNNKFNIEKYSDFDVLMRFLDNLLKPEPKTSRRLSGKIKGLFKSRHRHRLAESDKITDIIRHVGQSTLDSDPVLSAVAHNRKHLTINREDYWFRFVNQVCNKVLHRFGQDLHDQLSGANVFNIFGTIGAAGSLYTLLAPYFVSYGLFGRGRNLTNEIADHFKTDFNQSSKEAKVAHFTDTFYEINGVALTLQQQAKLAGVTGKDMTIVTCGKDYPSQVGKIRNFDPIDVFQLPEYPEQKIFIPPFLEILRFVYENEINYIQCATPGPMGLVGLAIARIMNLPISGTYHTAIPQYAAYLTGDESIEQLVWRYTLWYYDQMEIVYVPSRDTGDELVEKGISREKVRQYPRGVDTINFHPSFRNGFFERNYSLKNKLKLLYVGRVSKEKNMPLLADAFKALSREHDDIHLIIIGNGPYMEEMKKNLKGAACTFTGYMEGNDLSEAFASADIFVFPSTTDTFGNVILEAQASALPVVVTDSGGPCENMLPGETGLAAKANDLNSFIETVNTLIKDRIRLKRMSRAARNYMESRSFEKAFEEHWKLYSSRIGGSIAMEETRHTARVN